METQSQGSIQEADKTFNQVYDSNQGSGYAVIQKTPNRQWPYQEQDIAPDDMAIPKANQSVKSSFPGKLFRTTLNSRWKLVFTSPWRQNWDN